MSSYLTPDRPQTPKLSTQHKGRSDVFLLNPRPPPNYPTNRVAWRLPRLARHRRGHLRPSCLLRERLPGIEIQYNTIQGNDGMQEWGGGGDMFWDTCTRLDGYKKECLPPRFTTIPLTTATTYTCPPSPPPGQRRHAAQARAGRGGEGGARRPGRVCLCR